MRALRSVIAWLTAPLAAEGPTHALGTASPGAPAASPRGPAFGPTDAARSSPGCPESVLQEMNSHAQVVEFVQWMRAWGFVGRYTSEDIVGFFAWWADESHVRRMPDQNLLAALGKYPGVKKSRDRIKDPSTNRVIKLASGSPVRRNHYTIGESVEVELASPRGAAQQRRGRRPSPGAANARPSPSRIAA